MRRARHLQRTGEIPGNRWDVAVCSRWGTGVDLPGRGGGTEHQLGVVAVVSSARCGRTALSSVAIRFEACWGRAFLLGTSAQCRPAPSLCGVYARKLASLGATPSSHGGCHVGALRCQGFRFALPAEAPVSVWRTCFVHSRVRRSLPQLRLSWASVRLAAFLPRRSMFATMKTSGESFCSGRVAPSSHFQ